MKLHIQIAGKTRSVDYKPGASTVTLDGEVLEVHALVLRPGILSLIVEGRAWRVVLDDGVDESAVHLAGERVAYNLDDPRSLKARRTHAGDADGPIHIKASMPGRVVRVLAQQGDAVEAHQGIIVIEAMKMQNELKSPRSGHLAELRVSPGDTVASGDVLAVIE
ncbi:MAG TPA: biotin/lipoyl-containing protein [Acidobacteriaceae bacterium]|nr:biotin/lipoyl-containing protein [Acidobacteriaceae bacterium]